ncbi:MAG: endonuclease III [Clostridia bacterium]|nr:endonuclease III [Clostridia bacterium]
MEKVKQANKKYVKRNNKQAEEILLILSKEYPDAICGLEFKSPIELVCALILAAQCTDARVNQIIPILFQKFPDVYALAKAEVQDIQEIVKPCGFYINKSNAISNTAKIIVERFDGKVPDTMEDLTTLSGIGRKSANIILQECFGKIEGIAVDTHVTRLSRKMGISNESIQEKIENELMNKFDKKYWGVLNHVMVLHGRKFCIARRPQCDICPIKELCPKND